MISDLTKQAHFAELRTAYEANKDKKSFYFKGAIYNTECARIILDRAEQRLAAQAATDSEKTHG